MFAENPAVFLRDFGSPCSANGQPFTALVDRPDQVLQMAGVNVQATELQLTVAAADVALAGLAPGVAMVVDGQAAVVRDVMSVDDGAFFHVTFSR
jgi:hypothetical protein